MTSSSSQPSTCIQCSHGRCTLAFHPTCAYAAGVQFETSDWPFPIYCTCHRHQTSHREKVGSSFLIWDSIMFGLSSMCSCLKSTEMVGCLFTCNIFFTGFSMHVGVSYISLVILFIKPSKCQSIKVMYKTFFKSHAVSL